MFKSKTHWTNELFMFWRFSSKVLSNETDFIDPSFPTLAFSFTWTNDFEHFGFSHRFNLLHWHFPFSSFLLSFLLDHVGQNLWIFLLFTIHQICRDSAILNFLWFTFSILLLVCLDCLLHLDFLFEPFFIEKLSLKSLQCLSFFGDHFSFTSFLFPRLLLSVHSLTEPLLV